MNARRYFAKTAREALKRVKEELGPDAVILANRAVDGGTEILAAPAEALLRMAPPPVPAQPAAPVPAAAPALAQDEEDDFQVSLSHSLSRRAAPAEPAQPRGFQPFRPRTATAEETRAAVRGMQPAHPAEPPPAPRRAEVEAPVAAPAPVRAERVERTPAATRREETPAAMPREVMEELAALRTLVEQHCAASPGPRCPATPRRAASSPPNCWRRASPQNSRARLLDGVVGSDTLACARNELKTLISRQLMTLNADNDIVDRGGVYALVGPTGVGKTTTTAKLAARCVVRHGAGSVALITTDGYRIGAHEQLRIYGRILGVPVHVVRDASDLTAA